MRASVPNASANGTKPSNGATRSIRFSAQAQANVSLTDVHRRTRTRLLPLLAIEADLTMKLFPELANALNARPNSATQSHGNTLGEGKLSIGPPAMKEVCVRAGNGWKDVLMKLQKEQKDKLKGKGNAAGTTDELTTVLDSCREDIVSLWEDHAVRAVLKRRGVRMQDMPGL